MVCSRTAGRNLRSMCVVKSEIHRPLVTSGGLSQDFAGSGQNWVTAKNQVQAGSSHRAAHNITVAKFN